MVSRTRSKAKTKVAEKKKSSSAAAVGKTSRQSRRVPPPPAAGASGNELDAYFTKYSLDELDKAGYVRALDSKEKKWTDSLTQAAKERRRSRAQLNLAFSDAELNRFYSYAQKKHIPPSTLAKAWILQRLDEEQATG